MNIVGFTAGSAFTPIAGRAILAKPTKCCALKTSIVSIFKNIKRSLPVEGEKTFKGLPTDVTILILKKLDNISDLANVSLVNKFLNKVVADDVVWIPLGEKFNVKLKKDVPIYKQVVPHIPRKVASQKQRSLVLSVAEPVLTAGLVPVVIIQVIVCSLFPGLVNLK